MAYHEVNIKRSTKNFDNRSLVMVPILGNTCLAYAKQMGKEPRLTDKKANIEHLFFLLDDRRTRIQIRAFD